MLDMEEMTAILYGESKLKIFFWREYYSFFWIPSFNQIVYSDNFIMRKL